MSSIRKYLLIYLFSTIAITATVTSVCNYYASQFDINEHQDTLMAISAMSYEALLGNNLENRPLNEIQANLSHIPDKIKTYYPTSIFYSNIPNYYLERFNFQIHDNEGNVLLHSAGKISSEIGEIKPGFSDKLLKNNKWRFFSSENKNSNFRTIVGEKYNTRIELGKRIAIDELVVLLIILPLAAIFIWIIVGKSLKSLEMVAKEISNREANNYEPLISHETPQEIKPVIDELNMLLKRLKSGFERETRFAADAAHELKTPLAALKAQAQVALNTNDIDAKNTALNKVIVAADRTTRIVQQLLVLSKLAPEVNYNSKWQDVDLNVICKEVLTLLAPIAIENKVELELHCSNEIENFPGNQTAIGILLKNLVENSINYSGKDGKVTVKSYKQDNFIVLEVEDNGPGIAKEIQPRVFERFYRGLGNKKPGSGLGLAIVDEIAKIHNAEIKLNSGSKSGLIISVFFRTKAR